MNEKTKPPKRAVLSYWLGNVALFRGDFDQAISFYRECESLFPASFVGPKVYFAWADLAKGDFKAALELLDEAYVMDSSSDILAYRGFAYAKSGQDTEARAILDRLQKIGEVSFVNPTFFAIVHSGLGEHEKALDYLEQAVENRSTDVIAMRYHHWFDSLRDHPRFKALLTKMGIEETE